MAATSILSQIFFLRSLELLTVRDAVSAAVNRRHSQIRELWNSMLHGIDVDTSNQYLVETAHASMVGNSLTGWACHCDACKKRTGSAYGISLPVDDDAVEKFVGTTTVFTRVGESGKKVDHEFCPNCGTTVRWRVERIGNRQCFAGGALDDPAQIEVGGEMYADEALPWARLGCEISFPNAPDANFISELRERAEISNRSI